MSKEKKYRFYFSQKQSDIDEDLWDMPTRFVFVKTPNGYKQYSECCSLKGSKCNWSDAELVYETDDNPEIITHEAIPELISDLEAKLAEKDQAIEGLQGINQRLGQTCNNDSKEIERLREQLAEEKNRNKKLNHEAQKYYEDAYCNNFQNQKAIAELEKVKEYIREFVGINDVKFICTTTITDQIDQQIKSLKGEK